MIAYTITAPLENGTSYERTESGSGSVFRIEPIWQLGEESKTIQNDEANGKTNVVRADGGESRSITYTSQRIIDGYVEDWNGATFEHGSGAGDFHETVSPEGFFSATNSHGYTWTVIRQSDNAWWYENGEPVTSRIETGMEYGTGTGHVMAFLTAAPAGGGASVGNRYFNTIALQTTTKTTVTNYGKITTTTQEKLAKVGTTITQSVGTSVVTLPTTTNAKSWTENTMTTTTATEDATVVTTSRGIDSYWKKTAHTVYILGKNETTAFLKSNVALNATNGGPTDTAAYDTYSGPKTFTITRAAGTTSQNPVVADTADTSPIRPGTIIKNRTYRSIVAENITATYYTSWGPPFQFNLPLLSSTRIIQTGASESSSTRAFNELDGSISFGTGAKTTTRSAWGQTSATYSLAGVSWTASYATYTEQTYAQPIVRSGSGSYQNDGPTLDEDGNEVEGVTQAEGGANGFGEQANYFVNFQNERTYRNNPDGAGAAYGLAHAWGTLGGTTATPRQSISVSGIASSESVTWPFVSISAGVRTPMPTVTVSQKPETSATSSTAATKTEATTRRIWGEEFAKTTSSQNSSTGTSGSTITPIQAGGAAITSFQIGPHDYRGFPIGELAGGWIPVPNMYVIGGIARISESTIIIPPGEYVNATFTEPKSFSGSSIANTYFEPKAAVTYLCYPS